jgi:hypothetical protein
MIDKAERTTLREWLATWGDGPNWSDKSGATVPTAKTSLLGLLDYADAKDAEIDRAWAALKVDPKEAADDPDTAELADSIGVSLQYERDRIEMAAQAILDLASARLRNPPLDPNVEHDLKEIERISTMLLKR